MRDTNKLSYRQTIPQRAYMELAATLVLCARAGHPFSDRQLESIAEWIGAHNSSFRAEKWIACIDRARKGNEVTTK